MNELEVVKTILGKMVKDSWDKFISQTPQDSKWFDTFILYQEQNKDLYTAWRITLKLKKRNNFNWKLD